MAYDPVEMASIQLLYPEVTGYVGWPTLTTVTM